ncbi:MAG: DUF6529 family protein [Acidimicrobiales bacterium]
MSTEQLLTEEAAKGADGKSGDGNAEATPRQAMVRLGVLIAIGALVSLSLGAYARIHTPTGQGVFAFGFPAVLPMKAWLTTGAAALAIAQLLSALWMWGRLPGLGAAPSWTAPAHRWLGTTAFLLTLPVAYHCLWALGFQQTTSRVLIHSLLGCAFYGAFVTKMLALRSERLPGWSLPAMGGLLVALLTGLWLSSSLWFFTTIGFPGV